MNIHTIANYLNELADNSHTGFTFDCLPIAGEVDVLQVTIVNREELPIFVSVTEDQILCIAYLWGEDEVNPKSRSEMLDRSPLRRCTWPRCGTGRGGPEGPRGEPSQSR